VSVCPQQSCPGGLAKGTVFKMAFWGSAPLPLPPWREVQGGGGENNTNVPRNLPVPLGTKVLLRLKPQNTPLPSQVTLLIHSGPTFSGPTSDVCDEKKWKSHPCACRERPLAFAKAHFKHLPPRQGLFRGKHFRNYVASHAAGSPWNTIGSGLRMGAIQWEWWRFCTPEGCCVWKALGPSPRIQGPWGVDAFSGSHIQLVSPCLRWSAPVSGGPFFCTSEDGSYSLASW